uniref:Uncharacterized protein n=1 Tax=Globodera rostochiensis TaxID=31243 RepID=A0A914HJR0_GLORO
MNAKLSVALLIVLLVSVAYSAPNENGKAPLKATNGGEDCPPGQSKCLGTCYKTCSTDDECVLLNLKVCKVNLLLCNLRVCLAQ